ANRHNDGMATTLVGGLFVNNSLHYVHVGDSRLYRLRDGHLEQMTRDHSLIQELIDRGFYTEEEAAQSGKKNLVTRGLGVDDLVEPDVASDIVEVDDLYLFCSDGLTDMVEVDQVQSIAKHYLDDVDHLAQLLIDAANERGGEDNISVVAVHVKKPFPRRRWYRAKSMSGKLELAGLTDVGRAREHNEDSIALDPDSGVVVLADGMGGMNAGEVASAIAVKSILDKITDGLEDLDVSDLVTAPSEASTEVDFILDDGEAPSDDLGDTQAEFDALDAPAMLVEEVDVDDLTPEQSESFGADSGLTTDATSDDTVVPIGVANPNHVDIFAIDAETERAFTDVNAITGTGDVAERMRALLSDDGEIESIQISPDGSIDEGPRFEDQYNHLLQSQADDDFDLFDIDEPAVIDGDEYDLAVRSLRSGTWLEFDSGEGDTLRARLTWISSINGTYMFTDRKGIKVAEHSAQALGGALRSNTARILSDVPLYDRALSNLMERLKGEMVSLEETSPA
nr:DUF1631 family protein [Gammaproteobacteria bacterium]